MDDWAEFRVPPPEWDPDESHHGCVHCDSKFGTMKRRHHCRGCGKIFCNQCSKKKVALPQFHLGEERVCDECFTKQKDINDKLQKLKKMRKEVENLEKSLSKFQKKIDFLREGNVFYKIIEKGAMHERIICLNEDISAITSRDPQKSKSNKSIKLSDIREIKEGCQTERFKKVKKVNEKLCFSIIYGHNDTMDLQLKEENERVHHKWVKALNKLLDYSRQSNTLKEKTKEMEDMKHQLHSLIPESKGEDKKSHKSPKTAFRSKSMVSSREVSTKGQMEETKAKLQQNIETLGNLETKTAQLEESAKSFLMMTEQLKLQAKAGKI